MKAADRPKPLPENRTGLIISCLGVSFFVVLLLLAGCTHPPTASGPVASPTAAFSPSPDVPTNAQETSPSNNHTPNTTASHQQLPTPVLPSTATQSPPILSVRGAEDYPILAGEISFDQWEQVLALAWSSDGRTLAASAGDAIHLIDVETFKEMSQIQSDAWVNRLAFSPNPSPYEIAAITKDGQLLLWRSDNETLCRFSAHSKGGNSLDFSPGRDLLATSGNDGVVRLWELSSFWKSGTCDEQQAAEMIGGSFVVPDVAFHPDGELLAAVNRSRVLVRETDSQRLAITLAAPESTVIYDIAFSPDGTWLAAAESGERLRIWDSISAQEIALLAPEIFKNHSTSFFWSVSFSPDGERLAAGSSRGEMWIWRISPDGEFSLELQLPAHQQALTSIVFSPDSRHLASAGLDCHVRVWELP